MSEFRGVAHLSEVLAEYDEVRQRKFAICDNEVDSGVLTYATPIIVPGSNVMFSLGVCGLKSRLQRISVKDVETHLKAQANRIAERLASK